MSQSDLPYVTTPIQPGDPGTDFRCGNHSLDDYFRRHALKNDAEGIGRTYVLRRREADPPELPHVLGYYTLSMAQAEANPLSSALAKKLPKYPMPVALIGRLAVDARVQGRGVGEILLLDALRRAIDAAQIVGCIGILVDALDEGAERFYAKYDFGTVAPESWPRRMFLPLSTAKAAFEE
jgi:GNAT superfamily N-acetyltransferase